MTCFRLFSNFASSLSSIVQTCQYVQPFKQMGSRGASFLLPGLVACACVVGMLAFKQSCSAEALWESVPGSSSLGPGSLQHSRRYSISHDRFRSTYPTSRSQSIRDKRLPAARVFPRPELEVASVHLNSRGEIFLPRLPGFKTEYRGRIATATPGGDYVFYTLDKQLQDYAQKLLINTRAPHVAIIAMEPKTGRILAATSKSTSIKELNLHSQIPAASLIKVITSAAALEQGSLQPSSRIAFRGGNYTLNKYNYRPSSRHDKRSMNLTEALGKSCNPVFARVALKHLDAPTLSEYVEAFGFNHDLQFDVPGLESPAHVPSSEFELSRTAAGFGKVYISPIHAATLMSAIANDGLFPRPTMVDSVVSQSGIVKYRAYPQSLFRVVQPDTARTLRSMMVSTTTKGTSRRAFMGRHGPLLGKIAVAGKTGTLTGKNPAGLSKWFIGAAPANNPELVIAALVIKPGNSLASPSHLASKIFQRYFTAPVN
jgi:membrane peptidoglycan carboxypeptidase